MTLQPLSEAEVEVFILKIKQAGQSTIFNIL